MKHSILKTVANKHFLKSCCLTAFFALSVIDVSAADSYRSSKSNSSDMVVEATQQKIKVKGTVKDINGEPLIGATIVNKFAKDEGTIADFDGNFEISISPTATLLVSYTGYVTQEVQVKGSERLNIKLREDSKVLEEVVVVGFGSTSVRKNSASIASVSTEKVQNIPFADMASALQGRVAGVIVQQGSAEPGQAGASISIRGNGEPLYVIDGFISTKSRYTALNKADIKSQTVLKDAASTAVYGMNAGNGVIVVTTRQGEAGKLNVNYQNNFAYSTPSYPAKRMNAYQYATAINNLYQGLGSGVNAFKTPEEMAEIRDNLGSYTDWDRVALRSYAPQSEHTLSLVGGSDKLKFFGSLNYLGQDGIYTENVINSDRYNYRTNVSSNFDNIGLTIDFNVNGTVTDERYPPASAYTIYSRLKDRTPFEKPFTSDGLLSNQFDNPMLILMSPGYIKMRTVYNQLAMGATWKLPWVDGLSFGFNGNYNIDSQDRVDWIETATYYDEAGNATKEEPENISISRSSYQVSRYDVNLRADYKKTIAKKHNLSATFVHTRQYYYTKSLNAGSRGFYTTAIHQIQKGDASTVTASNSEGKQAWLGYVGRLGYDYNNRYMVEFSGRYDGSDNFPKGNRWGFFPSVSGGWAISEEGFFQGIKNTNILTYLKLRGSYGKIGLNGADHWAYAYLPTYNYNTNGYVVDGKLVNTVTPGAMPSVNMTWYDRTKYDLGVDLFLFNDQVEVVLDYFFERTKGYLSSAQYEFTDPLGYSLPLVVSRAENRNAGFDGSIKYNTKFGEVDFNAGFNFTYYKTYSFRTNEDKVTLANPRIRTQGTYGGKLGTGYVGSKFYQTPEEVLNNPKRITSRDLRPGDLMYKDVNGDGKIDGQDQTKFGHNPSPSFVFGFDLGAAYKGFNLMANIQGTGKRQTYMSNFAMASEGERRLDFDYQLNTWSPENRNAGFPRPGNQTMNDNNNYASSDFWARSSNYVRLKSLTLSYDFKYSLLRNTTWLNNLSVFVSGVNLFAIGPSVKYGDPEANNFDGYSYPMMRTYSFGFQVGF